MTNVIHRTCARGVEKPGAACQQNIGAGGRRKVMFLQLPKRKHAAEVISVTQITILKVCHKVQVGHQAGSRVVTQQCLSQALC